MLYSYDVQIHTCKRHDFHALENGGMQMAAIDPKIRHVLIMELNDIIEVKSMFFS